MRMKKNWFKILLLLISTILVVLGIYKFFVKEKRQEEISYIEILHDGTKRNTSQYLKEKKIINGIELSDMELIEKNDGTIEFSAIAKNIITEKIDSYMLQIKLLSNDNQTITNTYVSVMNLEPNDTLAINGIIEKIDISKVYNTEIIKLESVK